MTKYFSLIFDQVKIPINLYHIPGTSAVPITRRLLHSLEHYPNLAGIKDSNGDVPEYEMYLKEFPKLNMRTGTGNNLKSALNTAWERFLPKAICSPSESRRCLRRIAQGRTTMSR